MSKRLTDTLSRSEEITVMVFKDNDTSRSFQVSLGWITRLGFGLGALLMAALISGFFALKFYRVAHKADPTRAEGLERQIADLKSLNQGLESRLAMQAGAQGKGVNILPAPTVTVTVAAPALGSNAAAIPLAAPAPAPGGLLLFSALPKQTQDLSANAASLPITISSARTAWTKGGHNLSVSFNIQYTGTDRGSQQGRIIVIARGTSLLLAYPQGVLSRAGSDSLIVPPQGEYFSVSRFREVKADFSEAKSIQDVEVLITSLEGQLLYYQKVAVPVAPAAPAHTAKPAPKATTDSTADGDAKAEPTDAADSKASDIIEPGTDQ